MDVAEIYRFLFETYEGIGCLVGAGLVLSLLACVIMERRTRKIFTNHAAEDDDWSFFDDDDEDDDNDENDDEKVRSKVSSTKGKG